MNETQIKDENNQTKLIYKLSDDKIIQRFVFKTTSKERKNNTNDILILKKDEKKFNDLLEETLWFKVPNDFDLNKNKKLKFNMNTIKNNIYITRVSKYIRFETNNSQIHDFDQLLNYQSALIYTFEENNNLDRNRFELLKYKNPLILDGKWTLNMLNNRTCNLILSLKFIKCQFKTTRSFELSVPYNTNEMRLDHFQTNNLFSQKFDIDERLNAFALKLKIISNNNNNELDDELSISFQISLKKDEIKHNELRFEELIRKYFIIPIDCYYFNANLFEIKSNDTSIVFEQAARQSMNILQFISDDYLINNDNHPQPLKLNRDTYIEKLTELNGLIQNLQQLENSSEYQRGKREVINFYKKKIPQALNMKNLESKIIDVNIYKLINLLTCVIENSH